MSGVLCILHVVALLATSIHDEKVTTSFQISPELNEVSNDKTSSNQQKADLGKGLGLNEDLNKREKKLSFENIKYDNFGAGLVKKYSSPGDTLIIYLEYLLNDEFLSPQECMNIIDSITIPKDKIYAPKYASPSNNEIFKLDDTFGESFYRNLYMENNDYNGNLLFLDQIIKLGQNSERLSKDYSLPINDGFCKMKHLFEKVFEGSLFNQNDLSSDLGSQYIDFYKKSSEIESQMIEVFEEVCKINKMDSDLKYLSSIYKQIKVIQGLRKRFGKLFNPKKFNSDLICNLFTSILICFDVIENSLSFYYYIRYYNIKRGFAESFIYSAKSITIKTCISKLITSILMFIDYDHDHVIPDLLDLSNVKYWNSNGLSKYFKLPYYRIKKNDMEEYITTTIDTWKDTAMNKKSIDQRAMDGLRLFILEKARYSNPEISEKTKELMIKKLDIVEKMIDVVNEHKDVSNDNTSDGLTKHSNKAFDDESKEDALNDTSNSGKSPANIKGNRRWILIILVTCLLGYISFTAYKILIKNKN